MARHKATQPETSPAIGRGLKSTLVQPQQCHAQPCYAVWLGSPSALQRCTVLGWHAPGDQALLRLIGLLHAMLLVVGLLHAMVWWWTPVIVQRGWSVHDLMVAGGWGKAAVRGWVAKAALGHVAHWELQPGSRGSALQYPSGVSACTCNCRSTAAMANRGDGNQLTSLVAQPGHVPSGSTPFLPHFQLHATTAVRANTSSLGPVLLQ